MNLDHVESYRGKMSVHTLSLNLLPFIVITVKPVCNDHLANKIHYLWFIQ